MSLGSNARHAFSARIKTPVANKFHPNRPRARLQPIRAEQGDEAKPTSDQPKDDDDDDDDDVIPDEVWDAEEKAAPGRNARLVVYTLIGAAAMFVGVGRIESLRLSQAESTTSINDILLVVADIGIVPLTAYFAYEDMKNRYENVDRIWKEVKASKAVGGSGKGKGNTKGGKKGALPASTKGFGGAAAKPSPRPTEKNPEGKKAESGPLSGVKKMFNQANEEAKVQALQMNYMLEDKGVLNKLDQNGDEQQSPDTRNAQAAAAGSGSKSRGRKKKGKR